MNIGRASLAALLWVTIVALFTTNAVLALIPALTAAFDASDRTGIPEGMPETIQTMIIPMSRILIGMIVAFIAGWWGTSGLPRWRQQGLLIGAFVAVLGLVLAAAGDGITTRSIAVLLDSAGAFAGAALASAAVGIRRAFTAASIHFFVATIGTLIASFLFLYRLRGPGGELGEAEFAVFASYQPWMFLLVSATMAFLTAWWGTRGLGAAAVRHGLLIGVLAVGFFCTFLIILGSVPDWLSLLILFPIVVGSAMAGAVFARSRNHAQPA